MTLQNVRIEKEPAPSTDWRVYGDIQDNYGNPLGMKSVHKLTTVLDTMVAKVKSQ